MFSQGIYRFGVLYAYLQSFEARPRSLISQEQNTTFFFVCPAELLFDFFAHIRQEIPWQPWAWIAVSNPSEPPRPSLSHTHSLTGTRRAHSTGHWLALSLVLLKPARLLHSQKQVGILKYSRGFAAVNDTLALHSKRQRWAEIKTVFAEVRSEVCR